MIKILKTVLGVSYAIGACITVILSVILLLRVDFVINPEAMIPFKLYEQAFILLAVGAIPIIILCYGVYKVYDIKNSYHYKRNKILIFMPSIICSSCAVFVVGILFIGMINSFVLN